MEVHNHTHSTRKKWYHYLWEFIMLFLAVFCGFFAENLRENSAEHQREMQYARTLYEDLKTDTATLQKAIDAIAYVTPRIDTFRSMVQTQAINSLPGGRWYYYGRFGTRYFHLALQDATMEQLKSSGGLRYFKKQDAVNAIARYDQACRDLRTMLNFQDLIYADLIKTRDVLFNAWYMDEIMDFDISPTNIDSFKLRAMPLLSNQKNDFIKYANFCQLRSYNNKLLKRSEETALQNAEDLLATLKKEYRLN